MSRLLDVDFANSFQTQEREEEARLRRLLEVDVTDFETWLELIKQVEKYVRFIQKSNDKNKAVYQDFLQEFPQYYPVWRKLADCYTLEDNSEMVICTFEEGLKFLPVSCELWLHYCSWKMTRSNPDETRALFDRAVLACGKVYTSNLLWDKLLDFEKSQKSTERMEYLFSQLITFPTNKLYEYYTRFKNFIDAQYKDQEEVKRRKKDEVVATYEKVVTENNKRKNFEQGIKRSNFSTKALDSEQLENWRKYLDYEEKEKNEEKIEMLYERCVVPCCYYAEFWIRYARYIERKKGAGAARDLYERANKSFLKWRPELVVAQGYFEEVHGDLDSARKLYRNAYENIAYGLLDGVFKHIHLERRQKNYEEVDRLFRFALDISFANGQSGHIVFVTAQYAQFCQYLMGELEKAVEIFEASLGRAGDQKELFYAYINALNCLSDRDNRLERVKSAYERAVSAESKLPANDQLEMWVAYIDFMRNSWQISEDVKEVEIRFKKVFHHQNIMTNDFKNRCKIRRTKREENIDYQDIIAK
jgi:pre-mRNA-processing factor 39